MTQFVIKNQEGEYLSRFSLDATGSEALFNPQEVYAIKFDGMEIALAITHCHVLEPLTLDVYDLDMMLKHDNEPIAPYGSEEAFHLGFR